MGYTALATIIVIVLILAYAYEKGWLNPYLPASWGKIVVNPLAMTMRGHSGFRGMQGYPSPTGGEGAGYPKDGPCGCEAGYSICELGRPCWEPGPCGAEYL